MVDASTDPNDFTNLYNTPLTPELQNSYSTRYSPNDSYDYDMSGFHASNPNPNMTEGQHFPDTFKKPNHPTFSDQSQYHGIDGNEGGHWGLLDNGQFTFTTGKTNLQYHSKEELQDYFKRVEPNNKLILPED
jgi:hypothetical protein